MPASDHRVALDPEDVVAVLAADHVGHLEVLLDVLLGEDRLAGGDLTDERQARAADRPLRLARPAARSPAAWSGRAAAARSSRGSRGGRARSRTSAGRRPCRSRARSAGSRASPRTCAMKSKISFWRLVRSTGSSLAPLGSLDGRTHVRRVDAPPDGCKRRAARTRARSPRPSRIASPSSGCGGTGRRARLRALWPAQAVEVRLLSAASGNPR